MAYITTKKNLMKFQNRLSGKIGLVEIPKHRSIDIDTIDDLKIAELIINSKNFSVNMRLIIKSPNFFSYI